MTDIEESSTSGPGPIPESDKWIDCQDARVRFYARSSAVVLVAVSGQVDAANAETVSHHIHRSVPIGRPVVVDISDVTFLSLEGVRLLRAFGDECAAAGIPWVLVISRAVTSLPAVLDPADGLPVAGSLGEGLGRLAADRIT